MEQKDYFKSLVKRILKDKDVSLLRCRFEKVDNMVIISIKNHLKEGMDLESFKILDVVQQLIVPLKITFSQQPCWNTNETHLDKVVISFEEKDYALLNKKLETGIF